MQALQSEILSGVEITPPSSQAPQSPRAIVILLHGVGSNGDDLIGLASSYQQIIGDMPIAYLSPHAPFAWDVAPMALPDAYQWFSIKGYDPANRDFDKFLTQWGAAVRSAQDLLADFIAEQSARFGLAAERIVLVGFSQGTMMSLYASLHHRKHGRRFAGVVGYSGALLGQEDFKDFTATDDLPPYLLLHGQDDDIVPHKASEKACEFLKSIGAEVDLHIYPQLPHAINQEGLTAAGQFIKEKLAIS